MSKALSDLRILELESGIGGSYCGKLMADYGAEVIKVEQPCAGDNLRRIGPFAGNEPGVERSLLYQFLNTNKKSITLNLQHETGQDIFRQLAGNADVIIEGFRPNYLAALGLSYQDLNAVNPGLVSCSITYFGQTGPYRDYEGSSIVASAMGGLMYITGEPSREPLKIAGWQAEYLSGVHAAVAVMAAVSARAIGGYGQQVDVSIMEVVASILEHSTVLYSYTGRVRNRAGNRHGLVHPMSIMPCKDGYVAVVSGGDWENFVRFTGIDELRNERFETGEERLIYADEIDELLRPWLLKHTREELFHSAQEWRVPFAMVLGIDELLTDPQLQYREFFHWIQHPAIGDICLPGAPFRMSETPWRLGRAPLLGEHNECVYGGPPEPELSGNDRRAARRHAIVPGGDRHGNEWHLGLTRERIAVLKEQGVI